MFDGSIDTARAVARQTEGAEVSILSHGGPPATLQLYTDYDSAGSTAPSENKSKQPEGLVTRAVQAIERRSAPAPPPGKAEAKQTAELKQAVLRDQQTEKYSTARC